MSEENVPKLRLKPKLAAEPVHIPSPPAVTPLAPDSKPPVSADEPKAFRLKPKLAAEPAAPLVPKSESIAPLEPSPAQNPVELPTVIGNFPPPAG